MASFTPATLSFIDSQLSAYAESIDDIEAPEGINLAELSLEKVPLPPQGVGRGTLPSGVPFLVCHYSQNGAPSPEVDVVEFIFRKAIRRVPLTVLSGDSNAPSTAKPQYYDVWHSIRFEGGELVSERIIKDLDFIRLMLEAGGNDKTNHRKLITE